VSLYRTDFLYFVFFREIPIMKPEVLLRKEEKSK